MHGTHRKLPAASTGLDVLREHLSREALGELVGAAGLIEVHAFLQRGRLAWATTSRSRRTFRQYLAAVCGVSDARLGELFATCRAERRPLGEALLASGLATQEQVESALRQQLATALLDLAALEATQVVLLPRSWTDSEHTLTFSLDELVRPSTAPTPVPFVPPGAGLLAQLTRQLPMLQWCVHTDGAAISAALPQGAGHAAGPVADLHHAAFVEGADLLLSRRPDDLLIGARTVDGSAWGALSLAGPMARAIAAFGTATLSVMPEPLTLGAGHVREGDSIGPEALSGDELLAVISVREREAFVAREGLEVGRLQRAMVAFAGLVSRLPPGSDVALRAWPGWWFGARSERSGATVWLVMEARAGNAPGLAWARLRATARQLEL
jgi:hypothetical protein